MSMCEKGTAFWNALLTDSCSNSHQSPEPFSIRCILRLRIHNPFIYFPVFYILKDAMENKYLLAAPENGLSKYGINMVGDNIAQWDIWLPGAIINFAFCPLWLRVPFMAAVLFVWTGILSVRQFGANVNV